MLKSMTVSCRGGLDLSSNVQELLNRPGEAIQLINYECSKEGGYRRISGFIEFGIPVPGSGKIKGVHLIDNHGILVAKEDGIYHSFDGTYWVQINRTVTDVDEATLNATPLEPRVLSGRYQFHTFRFLDELQVYITDGGGDPMYFLVKGEDRASALYTYRDITLGSELTGATISKFYKKHYLLGGLPNDPATFYYSSIAQSDIMVADGDINPQEKFSGSTSGYIGVGDPIVGLKSFRETLYVFCTNSIWKVIGLEAGNPQVTPVTRDIGCVDGNTIQEIGGNLLFLAPDGIRTVAGTERIGDVELGIISRKIQPLLDKVLADPRDYQFDSAIIRNKNQYRLFFSKPTAATEGEQQGIIAAYIFDPNTGNPSWNFSETRGYEVAEATTGFYDHREYIFHGNFSGGLMYGENGKDFNGVPINHVFQSPYIDFGDIGLRKNVHKIFLTMKPEGTVNLGMEVRYDYQSSDVYQPPLYQLDQITGPAVFGTAVFGEAIYGARDLPNRDVYAEGSGHTVSVRIVDQGFNDAPFDIQSLVYDVIANGRI